MLRDLLLLILVMLVVRAASRIVGGILQGLTGVSPHSQHSSRGGSARDPRRGHAPARGVQMVRDPVCGVYVVPDRALSLTHGSGLVYFCSADCRDKYRARPSGRTA
jgi:YHS domain-containing protein